jgi:hypothetical protein
VAKRYLNVATCRQLIEIGFLMESSLYISQVMTKVANVATKIMRLDTIVIEHEGATYGPRATSGPQRAIFLLEKSLFD